MTLREISLFVFPLLLGIAKVGMGKSDGIEMSKSVVKVNDLAYPWHKGNMIFPKYQRKLLRCGREVSCKTKTTNPRQQKENFPGLKQVRSQKRSVTGPPPGWWFYAKGHDKRSRGKASRAEESTPAPQRTAGEVLVDEFVEYLALKETGMLDRCLGKR